MTHYNIDLKPPRIARFLYVSGILASYILLGNHPFIISFWIASQLLQREKQGSCSLWVQTSPWNSEGQAKFCTWPCTLSYLILHAFASCCSKYGSFSILQILGTQVIRLGRVERPSPQHGCSHFVLCLPALSYRCCETPQYLVMSSLWLFSI